MVYEKRKSRFKKIFAGLFIFLAISAIFLQVFISRHLPLLIKERLSEIIIKGSDSLYKVEVGKFKVNFWGGAVRFNNLIVQIDSTKYRKLESTHRIPALTFYINLPEGHLSGLEIYQLFKFKKIIIKEIGFTSAYISLARHFKTTDTLETDSGPLWKLIKPNIEEIDIKKIICKDIKVDYQNIDSASAFRWKFEKCYINISDTHVDSTSAKDSTRLLYANDIALELNNIKLKTPDGLYDLQAEKTTYSSLKRLVQLKKFHFSPAVSRQGFIKNFPYQQEIYDLKIDEIIFNSFMLPQWLAHNKLEVKTVEIFSPSLSIHLDRNAKPSPYSKRGKYPHQLLQKAPFKILIDSINIKDADFTYSEISNETQRKAEIDFSNLNANITNVTNDNFALSKSSQCIADIQGNVFNTGNLHSIFLFDLLNRNGSFNIRSTISNLNATQLNPVFKALTGTKIQSFNIKSIDYTINGNENAGRGGLRMKYEDLSILINKIEDDKTLNKKGFLSFLTNKIVIYKANPMKNDEERIAADVVVQRNNKCSFFNLVWKILYTAAGDIVLRPVAQKKREKNKRKKK